MNTRAFGYRATTAVVGAMALAVIGASGIALAADDPYGDDDVAVSVDIAPVVGPGALAMTVAGGSSTLVENGSTATERQFTGSLPLVTVTDSRNPADIPAGAFWYVLGSITDFTATGGQPAIDSSESFGWTPELVTGDPGDVSAGSEVEPGDGFIDPEMLSMAYDSGDILANGTSWSARADLKLLTAATVAPGQYTATLTLSLFE